MSLIDDLKRITTKQKETLDLVTRKIVLDIGTRLVELSPVGDATVWKSPPPAGYTGGRFRANWQYSYGQIVQGDLPDIDPSGSVSTTRIFKGVSGNPTAGVHYLVNNLPYAQRLEDGWSQQAPRGMIGIVAIEFKGIANRVAAGIRK